jgi:hypothetical protein
VPLAELEERRIYYEEHGEGDPVLLLWEIPDELNGLTYSVLAAH